MADFADGSTDNSSDGGSPEKTLDIEAANSPDKKAAAAGASVNQGDIPVYSLNRPFFHIDLEEAVEAAVSTAKAKDYGVS